MHHQRSFLELPTHLRHRIYEYVGVAHKVIDLNWSHDEFRLPCSSGNDTPTIAEVICRHDMNDIIAIREDYFTMKEYWEQTSDRGRRWFVIHDSVCEKEGCFAWHGGFGLLLTCKTIFRELCERIYKENRFLLDRGAPRGFQRFMQMETTGIRALTHLTIRLDGEPPQSIDLSDHWTRTSALLPLKHYSRFGKQAYKEWSSLVTRLRDCSIVPGQLALFLVAYVPDVEEAKLVLQPLESLPSLKACGIWLNKKPYPGLNSLLKSRVEALVAPKEALENRGKRHVPFRYLDLPFEIRSRILGFSDLCARPHLEWKPSSYLLDEIDPLRRPSCDCFDSLARIDPYLHFDDCKRETEVVRRKPGNGLEMGGLYRRHCCACDSQEKCVVHNDPFMCIFDCAEHSSYVAPQRHAWTYYCHPLFLVSHQVRHDAIPIFFQRRQIVITPRGGIPLRHLRDNICCYFRWSEPPVLPRTELSLFLSSMPKEGLRHIRRLEWLLSTPHTYHTFSKTAYFDYLDTIDLMIQAMSLVTLTLVINMRPRPFPDWEADTNFEFYRQAFHPVNETAYYNTILNPLCRLGQNGLRNCWVYLQARQGDEHKYDATHTIDERAWERKIVGDEAYNAYHHGKPWQERFGKATEIRPRGFN